MKTADRVIGRIALPTIVVAATLLIIGLVVNAGATTSQNNAYIRVINCVVSYPASTRTQGDIEKCYRTVEQQMNIKLQRYDNSEK